MSYSDPTIPQPPQYDVFGKIDEINRRLEAMEHHEHSSLPPNALQLGGNSGLPCAAVGTSGSSPYAAKDDHAHAGLQLGGNAALAVSPTTNSSGVAVTASREDHVHQGSQVQLGNNVPNAVAGLGGPGSSALASRTDHIHFGALVGSATPLAVQATAVVGVSGNASREDHRHAGLQFAHTYALGGDSGIATGSTIVPISVNLTLPAVTNLVQITGTFEFSPIDATTFCIGNLAVDGSTQSGRAILRGGGVVATVSQTWHVSLAQGSHNFALTCTASSGGGGNLGGSGTSINIISIG